MRGVYLPIVLGNVGTHNYSVFESVVQCMF